MKPNNAWKKHVAAQLRAQTANQKFKQNANTRCWWYACFIYVKYGTVNGHISTITVLIEEAPSPYHPKFLLRLRPSELLYFKTNVVWHLPSLAPGDFFFHKTSHFTHIKYRHGVHLTGNLCSSVLFEHLFAVKASYFCVV